MIHTSEVILAMRRFIKDNQMVIIGIHYSPVHSGLAASERVHDPAAGTQFLGLVQGIHHVFEAGIGPLNQLDAFHLEDAAPQELPGSLRIDHVDRSAVIELG